MKTIEVEIWRGSEVESKHLVDAVVRSSDDRPILEFGEPERQIFPRSAIKPLQALALFSTGAVEKFQISNEELALASASHSAEIIHTQALKSWLSKVNLQIDDLECGSHSPYDETTYHQMICQKENYSALHNNCSGKHTGMLCAALAMNVPTKSYVQIQHPVQQRVRETLAEICDCEVNRFAIDGCSIPTFSVPMRSLALGMARWGVGFEGRMIPADSCQTIFQACVQNPFMVEGHKKFCSQLMNKMGSSVFVKTGAEGVMAAAVPALKAGLIVKSRDGADRAAQAAMGFLFRELRVLPQDSEFLKMPIWNRNKIQTGEIKVRV